MMEAKELLYLLPDCSLFSSQMEDEWIWKINCLATFTVKSAYQDMEEETIENFNWKEIQIKGLIPKINYFWWATTHVRILTIYNLNKRGFSFSNRCELCYKDMESIDHIFLHCSYAQEIWDAILKDLKVYWIHPKTMRNFMDSCTMSPYSHPFAKNMWLQIPPIMAWNIQKEWNNRVFKEERKNSNVISNIIKQQMRENVNTGSTCISKVLPTLLDLHLRKKWGIQPNLLKLNQNNVLLRESCSWLSLDSGWIKCNFDGCSKGNPSLSGVGGLIKDQGGRLIEVYGTNLGIGTNKRAESMAAWMGLSRLQHSSMENVILKGDSKLIIDS